MNAVMLLLALVLLLFVQHIVVDRFALKKLTYERRFSRLTAFQGETVEMVEVLGNKKLLPVPFIRAESRISPSLSFRADMETHISGEQYHKSVFYLRPYSQIIRSHTVLLKKRGFFQAGAVALTAGDLIGTASPATQVDTGAAIEVYPRLLNPEDIPLPSSRWQGDLIVKRWIVPDPVWVSGIRSYSPGDDPSGIHWPATARLGMLQMKVHDQTADVKLLIVINAQMSEHQWADLMEYEQQTVEYMISLAATLCVDALRNGVEAGFAANIPLDKEHEPAILPPARSSLRETEILSAMAHLTIARTRTFLSLLDALAAFTGMDMLLLSVYDSELIQMKINTLRLRGNTVALHLIDRHVPSASPQAGEGSAGHGQ